MTSFQQHWRKTLWTLGLVLGLSLISWRVGAGDEQLRAGANRQETAAALATILNPDGTLQAGRNGNFDVRGHRMEYTASGAPRFVPAAQADCNGWDTQFSLPGGTNGSVRALVVMGSDLYLGGQFTTAGNVAANGVAKFNLTTNTWSALGSGGGNGVDTSNVHALAVLGSDLYVGGYFLQANVGGTPVAANSVAKFSTTTNTWSALGSNGGNGVNFAARALVVIGSNLYVGGDFTRANVGPTEIGVHLIAKFDTTTSVWSALGPGFFPNHGDSLYAMAVQGNDLYVVGSFRYIAKYNTVTNTWSNAGGGLDSDVYAIALLGSDIYVGGNFHFATNPNNTPVRADYVARFNTTTSTWSALGPGAGTGTNEAVYALAVSGSDLYLGGGFSQANVGGAPINAYSVARFNTTTSTWSALGTGGGVGLNGAVLDLALLGSDLYVGGGFTQANVGGTPVSVNNVARFNTTTSAWSALGATTGNGVNNVVVALVVQGSDIYVGGSFISAGGVAANRVAKFNTTTNTWSALGSGAGNGVNGSVFALALLGSDLYVGGAFNQANAGGTQVSVNFVAKFNLTTNTWSAVGAGAGNGVNSFVNALWASGSDLYVGGSFNQANAGGTPVNANNVAKFNLTTGIWSALGSGAGNGVNGGVGLLKVLGSDLYVGGSFTQANVGGTPVNANRVAKFNLTTSTWSALGTGAGNGVNGSVSALALLGSDLYVGGTFTEANVGGTPINVNRVAKFNTTTGVWGALDTGTGDGVNGSVAALTVSGSDLYVGGSFTLANFGAVPVSAHRVARFSTTTNTWSALLDPGGGNGVDGNNPDPGSGRYVADLAVLGSGIYVGGLFSLAGDNKLSVNFGRFCNCDANLSKLDESFAANGSTGSFILTIADACPWTAISNDSFITITAPVGAVAGTGTVSYTVTGHSSPEARSGTITVAGLTFVIRQGAQFNDVPSGHLFYEFIGKLSARGITLGCGGGNFCPEADVTRDQMAAFIIRTLGDFNPPLPAMQRFADVPPSNIFYAFIEQLAVRQITLGCGGGNYCPTSPVTREQMAAFIIRALHAPGYVPPTPAAQRFADVPPSNLFYAHIEELAVRGITLGCGGGNYCPTANVTRAQMAAFLVRAFNL